MKNKIMLLIAIMGLVSGIRADNEPDPLTGQPQEGRSCLKKNQWGVCYEWKTFARDKDENVILRNGKPFYVAEQVCTAPAQGECTATVARGLDVATCKASQGASCRAAVIIR